MKIRSLFFSLLIYQLGFTQVTFEAKASKTTLGVNERLRIDFKMNEDGDNFTPQAFKGFKVVGIDVDEKKIRFNEYGAFYGRPEKQYTRINKYQERG